MIVKYYGGYIKKSKLIDMTKTTKKGTTAYHIIETLKNIGFDAKGVRANLCDINKENVILPCIASVTIDNSYKHFIVIYEINYNKKYLIIGDPADKVKKVSFNEFNKIFNNILIIFFPLKTLPIIKETSQITFIIKLLKNHKKLLFNIFILSIFITLFSIITSFYTEYMINSLNYYSKKHLLFIFYIFFSVYVLKIITNYFRNKLLSFISEKIDVELTIGVFKNIIKLPYSYYKNKSTGDIVSRINDLNTVRDMISKVALSIFVDLPLTLVSLVILYFINSKLFFIGLIILILYFVIIVLYRGIFNDYIKKIQSKKGEVSSFMVESISGFETVKGLHLENNIIDKFEKKYVKLLKDFFTYQNLYYFQNMFKEIINDIGFIVITLVGCLMVIKEEMSIGTLFTFSSLLIYFLEPIKNIINLDGTLKESNNCLKRILDIISYKEEKQKVFNTLNGGDVCIKNLNFSFNDRDYILKNINLNIKNNEKIMVVGSSGSGKSTLFKILMKYYKIKNNKIKINNVDVNDYSLDEINNNILYISQNEILFNDSLYNNLIFDNSDSSKLDNIKKICCLDEIIDENLGYNMLIEENGFNLSGGERQRIVLARTLLKKFKILIIDEGLSQVDISLERKILKNIFKNYKDKTIIFISHRLDNLDLFDKLIKLDKGEIKEVVRNG